MIMVETAPRHKIMCHFCQNDIILAGGYYFKALIDIDSKLEKVIACEKCLNEKVKDIYCYWKKRIKAKEDTIKDAKRLLFLFERLASSETVTDEIKLHKYLLALILLRRKKLKLVERVQVNEIFVLKLKLNRSERICEVEELNLNEEESEKLTRNFLQFLEVSE